MMKIVPARRFVSDASLELASFAGARLRDVAFEHVNLSEASFQEARLENVRFIDCELTGADFRGRGAPAASSAGRR